MDTFKTIFWTIVFFVIFLMLLHDFWIIRKYKRGKITKNQIKRKLENKNRVYIVSVRDKKNVYHYVRDENTLKKLGFEPSEISKKDSECFSNRIFGQKGYILGHSIQIYLDFKNIINILTSLAKK